MPSAFASRRSISSRSDPSFSSHRLLAQFSKDILGSDQKEYGPVSADQLRAWISQGRANGRTKVQAADSTEWKLLADLPEFADALKAAAERG